MQEMAFLEEEKKKRQDHQEYKQWMRYLSKDG